MSKERLVLALMKELGVTINDLIFIEKAFDNEGKLSLRVRVKEGAYTSDLKSFDANSRITPEGVIIDRKVFPFANQKIREVGVTGNYTFSEIAENKIVLPTKEQLDMFLEYYDQYKAIANLLGVPYYSRCAYQHPENSDGWVNFCNFEDRSYSAHNSATPFFSIGKL